MTLYAFGLPTTSLAETLRRSRPWFVWSPILMALLALLYGRIVKDLLWQSWNDSDYSYALLVPVFSAYVLWRERKKVATSQRKPSNFGLLVMLGGIVLLFGGTLGAELFTSRVSLVILLGGMALFLAGWEFLRALSFPLAFLLLMIPIPAIIFNQITFALQLLSSRLATLGLELVRVPVLREGNILVFPNYSLEVAEACSGIRSLMTLITLSVAYGHLSEPRRWARYTLAMAMVPAAVFTNAIRVMATGVVTYHFGFRAAEGFFHEFSGWLIFLCALVLMFSCHGFLKRVGGGYRPTNHA